MTRTFVMGDPQGPFDKVRAVLDRHGALEGHRLAFDVVLVSIGDHFDYDHKEPVAAGKEGLALLRWLASHEPSQVHILLGNHDVARVMELIALSDADFAAARALDRDAFAEKFPLLPPHGVLARDYASFCEEQRDLVQHLLLDGRFELACAGELDGKLALLTHAGVTTRELGLLGLPGERDPRTLATALNTLLRAAVERVRTDWDAGVPTPLSLAPLHVAGAHGVEGGGLLYHRPSNPDSGSTFDPDRPRRFDPRTLPDGLLQIAGHSGHAKCVHELGDWCTWRARERAHGGLRTLTVDDKGPRYDLGVQPDSTGWGWLAQLILIDGELRRVPAEDVQLLELARLL